MSPASQYRVGIGCDAAEALVTVQDPGLGISHELVSRVFELVLKRRLANGPGGSYSLNVAVPPLLTEQARQNAMPPPTFRVPGQRSRIVVVDDGPGARERLEALLKSSGFSAYILG